MKVYFTKYQGELRFRKAEAIDILTKKYIVRIRTSGIRITKKCGGKVVIDEDLNLED